MEGGICHLSILTPHSTLLTPRKPFSRFINRGDELIIADGLQEEVEGLDLVALEGIFLKGGGEDDTRL